jgi:hypothetical protein
MEPPRVLKLVLACSFALMFCASSRSTAYAGPWSYSAGAGLAGPYQAVPERYAESFGPGWGVAGSAIRWLNSSVGVRASSGWIHHQRMPGLAGIPEIPPATLVQRANFVPVTLGLRLHLPEVPSSEHRVFIDVSPALVWSRWSQRLTQSRDFNGNAIRDDSASETRLEPGVEFGLGMAVPHAGGLHPEFAARYLAAAAPGGAPINWFGQRPLQGLSQWTVGASVSWEP